MMMMFMVRAQRPHSALPPGQPLACLAYRTISSATLIAEIVVAVELAGANDHEGLPISLIPSAVTTPKSATRGHEILI
jgi:hypothetical protein